MPAARLGSSPPTSESRGRAVVFGTWFVLGPGTLVTLGVRVVSVTGAVVAVATGTQLGYRRRSGWPRWSDGVTDPVVELLAKAVAGLAVGLHFENLRPRPPEAVLEAADEVPTAPGSGKL
mgnify:CR=1 FL=1